MLKIKHYTVCLWFCKKWFGARHKSLSCSLVVPDDQTTSLIPVICNLNIIPVRR